MKKKKKKVLSSKNLLKNKVKKLLKEKGYRWVFEHNKKLYTLTKKSYRKAKQIDQKVYEHRKNGKRKGFEFSFGKNKKSGKKKTYILTEYGYKSIQKASERKLLAPPKSMASLYARLKFTDQKAGKGRKGRNKGWVQNGKPVGSLAQLFAYIKRRKNRKCPAGSERRRGGKTNISGEGRCVMSAWFKKLSKNDRKACRKEFRNTNTTAKQLNKWIKQRTKKSST